MNRSNLLRASCSIHNSFRFLTMYLVLLTHSMRSQQTEVRLPNAPQFQALAQQPSLTKDSPAANNLVPAPPVCDPLPRRQAEQLALKNNPRISVAALLALAQKQVVRETRSALFPPLNGDVTGGDAEEASRISSGSLTASRPLYHVGAGIELNQLITDFGRTRNLVASSSLQAKASEQQSQRSEE